MLTVLDVIQKTAEFLAARGVESARLNAEWLVGHALGLSRMQLYLQFERVLSESELERIRPLVRRRAQREPLQHILGEVEFFGLRLSVDRRALIPRPETEYLVELTLARVVNPPVTILDLGTGSGALALALAKAYPQATVLAVDSNPEAQALAAENAARTGLADRVSVIASDWFDGLPSGSRFDLVIANPPYLTEDETAAAEPEVRLFEPTAALLAQDAGMAALKHILTTAAGHLQSEGLLALETGIAQHDALRAFGAEQGWAEVESQPDLSGRDRYIFARRGSI